MKNTISVLMGWPRRKDCLSGVNMDYRQSWPSLYMEAFLVQTSRAAGQPPLLSASTAAANIVPDSARRWARSQLRFLVF
jgi:hypothetical protein